MRTVLAIILSVLPSFLRVPVLRMMGARIGANVRLGLFSILIADHTEMGDNVRLAPLSFVRARQIKLGKRVRIGSLSFISTGRLILGDDTIISKLAVVAGQVNRHSELVTGKRCWIFPFCWIDTTREVHMEDEVGVGGGSYIFTHGSWQSVLDGFPVAFGPVVLKRNVWLPWRVFILPNVTIGEYCTIAAGAVVNKSIPPYSLAGGVPAKVIRGDGQHLRQYDLDEKLGLVRRILRDAASQLEYDGHAVEVIEKGEGLELIVDRACIVFNQSFASMPDAEIIISWSRLPSEVLSQLDECGVKWFDLARRRCAYVGNGVFAVIKGAFSHYGVRFEPTRASEAMVLPDVEGPRPPTRMT